MKTALHTNPPFDDSSLKNTSAQKRLQLSELLYRRMFETAQDGILILDGRTGKIEDANPSITGILNYTQSELLGKQLWQIGVFTDIAQSKTAFSELQSKGYILYTNLPLQTKGGQTIDVEFVSNLYLVDHHKVIQCNIRDISDRKKAEAELITRTHDLELLSKAQSETKQAMLNIMEDLDTAKSLLVIQRAKDEAVFASIGEGLIAVDNNQKITIMNRVAEELLGCKNEKMIGQKITCFSLENEAGQAIPLAERPTNKALTTGTLISGNYFFVRKNNTRFPISIIVTPIKQGKKIIGAIDVFRDVTKEKQIDRAKTEFVALASHQLRTPLGISKWYIEAIRKKGYFDAVTAVGKDYFNEIYKCNERLLALVRDLLSVSRIDQGIVRNSPKIVNLTELLLSVLKNMNILAKKYTVTLDLKIKKSKLPEITIDPFLLQEVIENLITNAVMYSPSNGTVKIVVDFQNDQLCLNVKDDGIGISENDQKLLFTRFFRSDVAKAKNAEGSGLGLYVVKSYVDGWGGKIKVDSQKGKGSTFTIYLPLVAKNISV